MDLTDPGPGEAWKLDQFWICLECGRHFWTTYTLPKTAYAILRPNGVRERYPRDDTEGVTVPSASGIVDGLRNTRVVHVL